MSTKGCSGFLLLCLDLELLINMWNIWFLWVCRNPYLILTQDLNKIKKYAKHSLVDIGKWEACANFQQKVFNGG